MQWVYETDGFCQCVPRGYRSLLGRLAVRTQDLVQPPCLAAWEVHKHFRWNGPSIADEDPKAPIIVRVRAAASKSLSQ